MGFDDPYCWSGADCWCWLALRLALRLPQGLIIDEDIDLQRLAAAAIAHAAHRGGAQVIKTGSDADVGIGRADPVGRIERDPAEIGHEGFGPGVARLLVGHGVTAT